MLWLVGIALSAMAPENAGADLRETVYCDVVFQLTRGRSTREQITCPEIPAQERLTLRRVLTWRINPRLAIAARLC